MKDDEDGRFEGFRVGFMMTEVDEGERVGFVCRVAIWRVYRGGLTVVVELNEV